MADLQAPIITWQVKAGKSEVGLEEQKVLLIAQGSTKGFTGDVQPQEAKALLGEDTLAYQAWYRFYTFNKSNQIDVITLEEGVGNKAEGSITFTGSATESKNVSFRVGDDQYKVTVAIAKGDTATAVATKVASAIDGLSMFTASATAGVVTVTFDVVGTIGNGLVITVDTRITGLTVATTEFTGGSGVFDSEGVLDTLTERYQTVVFDEAMGFDVVETWLQSRINVTNTVKGGIGITAMQGSYSTVKAFAASKNSQSMVVVGNVDTMKYNALPILLAVEIAAKRALRLTEDAVLGDLVLDANEAYGGVEKSSLPYHNTPMSYRQPVNQLTIEQVMDLNDEGVSLLVPTNTGSVLGSMVTLYKFDNSGESDSTFHYLNAMDTSMSIQEYLFRNTQKQFGQTRATKGDLVMGMSMTNELSVKAYIISLYQDMVDMALTTGGEDALEYFKSGLTVSLDTTTGNYAVYAPTVIVSQFRGLQGVVAIQYNFK